MSRPSDAARTGEWLAGCGGNSATGSQDRPFTHRDFARGVIVGGPHDVDSTTWAGEGSHPAGALSHDLRSTTLLPQLVAESDLVFHLAAQVGNVKSIAEAETDAETNVLGSVRLLCACRHTGVRKVVYSSSSAVFGEAGTLPIDEDHPQRPASFYALSKSTAEHHAILAHTLWGVPAVCLRYFNVYGLPIEVSEYTGVISIFFHRLLAGEPLTIYGAGDQVRDFVFVSAARRSTSAGSRQVAPSARSRPSAGNRATSTPPPSRRARPLSPAPALRSRNQWRHGHCR